MEVNGDEDLWRWSSVEERREMRQEEEKGMLESQMKKGEREMKMLRRNLRERRGL